MKNILSICLAFVLCITCFTSAVAVEKYETKIEIENCIDYLNDSIAFVSNSVTECLDEETETNNSGEISDENEVTISLEDFLKDDFFTDVVMITLSHDATAQFISYSPKDFPEISCYNVKDLTSGRAEQIMEEAENKGIDAKEIVPEDFYTVLALTVNAASKDEIYNIICSLTEREDVISAMPNYKVTLMSTTPNDTYYCEQTASTIIDLPQAWDLCKKAKDVNVVIIDSGIDGTHLDLMDNLASAIQCRDYSSGNCAPANPVDSYGHGTEVAGIIGAAGNNAQGVSGVCWETNLISYRIIDQNGNLNTYNVLDAINCAQTNGMELINLSLGWHSNDTSLQTCALNAINAYTGLIICAAGNGDESTYNYGYDIGMSAVYPASFHLSNMIVVGASDFYDMPAYYSCYSSTLVDLFAPGGIVYTATAEYSVLTTRPASLCGSDSSNSFNQLTHYNTGYHYSQGTSIAAPYVTGVAALLMSYYPNMTPAQVKAAILNNVDSVTSLSGYCVTGGRLNAFNALSNP